MSATREPAAPATLPKVPWPLIALLVFSVGLRAFLVLRGGQGFFPDEGRYARSVTLVEQLGKGQVGLALDGLLGATDHTGFVVVGVLPALLQAAFQSPPRGTAALWLPALVLASASVLSIGLVYGIARRLQAPPTEALGASVLLSLSATYVYYSRHLLPYDSSMALGLGATFLGLAPLVRPWRSYAFGLLLGAAFLTYYGYWASVAVFFFLHVLRAARWEALRRATLAGAGFLSLPALLALAGAFRGGGYLAGVGRFSWRAVTQCDMKEGWALTFESLFHAEHGVLLLWAGGALLLALGTGLEERARSRGRLFLLAALSLYGLLVLASSGFGRLCIYGRLARQLVPFLCLATASAATALRRPWRCAALVFLAVSAAFNLRGPVLQRFPYDFAHQAGLGRLAMARETTVLGPESPPSIGARYVLLNARYLHPVLGTKPPPEGRVLLWARHPFEYLPYQYESHTAAERQILRSSDISMRLIDTEP